MITIDGVMQAPDGPDEDKSNGFEYGLLEMKNMAMLRLELLVNKTLSFYLIK